MRLRLFIALIVLMFLGLAQVSGQSRPTSANSKAEAPTARSVADAYMADLVAKRMDDAIAKMEPDFVESVGGRSKAKSALNNLFNYCGRPLNSEFKHAENGFKLYTTGRRKPMQKFYYAAATNQYRKGICFFAVEVVPGNSGGFQVTTFGPLKLVEGQLPDWLK